MSRLRPSEPHRQSAAFVVIGAVILPAVFQSIWTSFNFTSWLVAHGLPTYYTSVVFVILGFTFVAYRFRWWSLALAVAYLPAMYFFLWGISATIREFKFG